MEHPVTRNSRRKKRSRSIQHEQGVPYSVARRSAGADVSGGDFPRPDFAVLYADEEDMPPRIAAALWVAAGVLVDTHMIEPDEPVHWLPPVAHPEDPSILPKMLAVINGLSDALVQGEVVLPQNMAQQVAWAAMINEAEVVDDLAREDSERWTWYLQLDAGELELPDMDDILLPDADHEYLFEPRWDGIENDEAFTSFFRAPNLHPRRWFEPFYDEAGPGSS